MLHNLIQKGLVIGILLCFVGSSAIGMYDGKISQGSKPHNRDIILYVGGVGPGNYSSIQDAIDDANDGYTIFVYPGTYYENQIIIGKNITVTGAGASITIIDGNNAALDDCGLIRIIAPGDVTFSGFTIQNPGSTVDGNRMGMYAASDMDGSTYIISHNTILGTNNPDDEGDYGFYSNGGKETLIFTYNTMTQHGSNPILLEKHAGETDVSYNMLDEGVYGSVVYFSMTYDNQDITTLQKVSHNDINLGTGAHTGSDYYGGGIVFRSAFTGTPGKYTNVEISDNTIHTMKGYRRAISLSNDASDSGADSEIVSPLITGNTIIGTDEADSIGIQLRGSVTDALVQENSVSHCEKSFFGTEGVYSPGVYPSNTLVNCNNFEENILGFVWGGILILNAENNWWGDETGPSNTGNPGGLGDDVSTNVDYTPWLLHQCGPPYADYFYTISDRIVSFNASSSGDYDGTITSYAWNFGDQQTGQGMLISHTYSAYQSYVATLTVTDNNGNIDTCSKQIILHDYIPPQLSAIHDTPDPQHVGHFVNITCTAVDNVAVSTVIVYITSPDSVVTLHTMSYNPTTHQAFYNTTYSLQGTYTFFIWANDTNNNEVNSAPYFFTMTNTPPNMPSNPDPANGETNVDTTVTVSWTGTDPDPGETVTYDLYFGTTNPLPRVANNLTMNFYQFSSLLYETTYYWYIVSWDPHGAHTVGTVWYFMTENAPNNPPNAPGNPYPSNGQTSVSVTTDISWSCTDPDSGDTLTYDVFLGTVNPPPKILGNQSNVTYDPATLSFSTTYYWKIVAWDNHHAHTSGPVWSFTTDVNSPPSAPVINGPASGTIGKTYNYTFVAIDPEQNNISYEIDWGDGHVDPWYGPTASNTVITRSHTWTESGSYLIKARAKDIHGAIGAWGMLNIRMPTEIPEQSTQSQQISQQVQRPLIRMR